MLATLKQIDYDLIEKVLPFTSIEKMNSINKEFSKNKTLSQNEYNKWKMLKRSMTTIYKRFTIKIHKSLDEDETRAWITLDTIAKKGVCKEITLCLQQNK